MVVCIGKTERRLSKLQNRLPISIPSGGAHDEAGPPRFKDEALR
jgi:hypothetical protein